MGEHVESEPKLLGNAGVSRRQLLARSAVAAGVVWAAPVVRTASAYALTSAGTSRPCTQFYVAGLSLTGNWYPKYPYGFAASLEQTQKNNATPSQGGAITGVQTSRDGATSKHTTAPKKLSKHDYAKYFQGTQSTDGSKYTVPKLLDQWLRQNPSVPLLEPDVYPQITQTGAQGWAVLLPEVTGPNAAARQPRFIIGYAWQGSHYAYGYVDPRPANPALAGRRILFPSPVGREPGAGDGTSSHGNGHGHGRGTTTTSSSTSSTSSTTPSTTVAPTTTTAAPGAPAYGPPPAPTTTSTSTTTTSSTTTTTTTTLPPTTTTTSPEATTTTTSTTTTTLPPTTTTTRPGWGRGGSKGTTTTTAPPPTTTTTVPPTTTTSTTTTTLPSGSTTTTTTTTSPGGTTTTTTDPFSQWWIAAHSDNGSGGWGGTVPSGPGNGGGNGSGKGATSGEGKKIGFLDTGVGPAGPAGPGALSPTDSRAYADYFGVTGDATDIGPAQGAPIKGVILIYCKP
jgi:hypothetical protein